MLNLIIYDQEGIIVTQMSGDVRTPIGIPHMWVDVPQGKCVERVDVSGETHTPVFANLPKSETQILKEENLEIKMAIAELAEIIVGGI